MVESTNFSGTTIAALLKRKKVYMGARLFLLKHGHKPRNIVEHLERRKLPHNDSYFYTFIQINILQLMLRNFAVNCASIANNLKFGIHIYVGSFVTSNWRISWIEFSMNPWLLVNCQRMHLLILSLNARNQNQIAKFILHIGKHSCKIAIFILLWNCFHKIPF